MAKNKERYFCPICGTELEQGQYEFDEETRRFVTAYCPECDDFGSDVLDEVDAEIMFGKDFLKEC